MTLRSGLPEWNTDRRRPAAAEPEEVGFGTSLFGFLAVWSGRFMSGFLSGAALYGLSNGHPAQIGFGILGFVLPFAAAAARQLGWGLGPLRVWPVPWAVALGTSIVGVLMLLTLIDTEGGRAADRISRLDSAASVAGDDIAAKQQAVASAVAIRDQQAVRMAEAEAQLKPLDEEVNRLNAAMICEEQGGCAGWDGQAVTTPGRGPRWRDGQQARADAIAVRSAFLEEVGAKRADLAAAEAALAEANRQLEAAQVTSRGAEAAAVDIADDDQAKNLAKDSFEALFGGGGERASFGDFQLPLAIFIALCVDLIGIQKAPIPRLPAGASEWNDPFGALKTRRRRRRLQARQISLLRARNASLEAEAQSRIDAEVVKRQAAERHVEALLHAQEVAKSAVRREDTASVNARAVALKREMETAKAEPARRATLADIFKPAGLIEPPEETADERPRTDAQKPKLGERDQRPRRPAARQEELPGDPEVEQ